MAILTFTSTDETVTAAEARALSTCLALYLREIDLPEVVPPANVKFTYSETGSLHTVYVTLGDEQ